MDEHHYTTIIRVSILSVYTVSTKILETILKWIKSCQFLFLGLLQSEVEKNQDKPITRVLELPFIFYLWSLQLALCCVAALKSGPVHRP